MAYHLNTQTTRNHNVSNGAQNPVTEKSINILQGKRIFYVEDDARNRSVVQIILQHAGATVEFERWGFSETAVPKINAFRPDLILLDLMFPANVSGYDVFDALRRVPSLQKIPVVAVSASDPEIEIPKAKAKGLNGFIGKPISIENFATYLATVLDGHTVWEPQ